MSLAPLSTLSPRFDVTAVALVCGALLCVSAGVVMVVLGRAYRRLWRIEMSVVKLVGHNAAGRRSSLPWSHVQRVDVTGTGLVVAGRDALDRPARLFVPAAMPQFTVLAHRAVEYAEAHGRTVCVDGTPLDDLDLVALLPTICESVGVGA